MNAITGIIEDSDGTTAGTSGPPQLHTLRRSGRKAVRFYGWQLVEAKGANDSEPVWYDLAIYRSDAELVIVELVARRNLVSEQDLARVETFPTLAAAAAWLESYGVGNDVPIPASLAADTDSVAVAVLKAIQLRQRIARIQDDYHGLLSDIFEALNITDAPLVSGVAGPIESYHELDEPQLR